MHDNTRTKIGIVGLGLIGGSLALALCDSYDVLCYDTDVLAREAAAQQFTLAELGDMRACAAVFVCVPVKSMSDAIAAVRAAVGDDVIITDVASVKGPYDGTAGRYVGGHPMAGTERGGFAGAKKHLFEKAYWVLTRTGADAEYIAGIVSGIGAVPVYMTAAEHDKAVAAFSHVPHAAAYALTAVATDGGVRPIAGSGFLDTTRIAQSNEDFWTEVFMLNSKSVTAGIDRLVDELGSIRGLIDGGDRDALRAYIAAARKKRVALNRADLGGEVLYVDLVDRVGEFERITGAIARGGINLENIALVPGREGAGGALMLEFGNAADRLRAAEILGIEITTCKE